ncbi:thiamine phosphate synthase [Brevibacterium luteolum]|uniref:thiamine phosphate synthase n=1 Tax=Brevibacterium luteolum TaxID=199591 RepID=UPI0021AF3592|nr:thiamine phosphate synthase [Brevibacterium luteolum]MCT1872890.1 thiamine phosphate synthase [Brevibacterium luteolum]MCT1890963.1 thiamine phosphate synthase [Brevibacterium luteolum]MCT1893509.1 thiamine phosphate synthase [Brevibacterium luteolum]MCT1924239.1 thiamine phosphate synthase [Brevibacterium luteolum]
MSHDRLAGIDTALYFITDTAQCASAGRSVAETVAEAVAGGAGMVQIRDKDITDDAMYDLTCDVLRAVDEVLGDAKTTRPVPVFVNDRVAVVEQLNREGHLVHLHVGQDDMPFAEVRQHIGQEALLGLSATTPDEFAAAREAGSVDLLGVGLAFPTTTKKNARDVLGPGKIRALAGEAGLPVFGIGGIDLAGAAKMHGTGVTGICVVSAICTAADPRAAAAAIKTAFLTGQAPDAEDRTETHDNTGSHTADGGR